MSKIEKDLKSRWLSLMSDMEIGDNLKTFGSICSMYSEQHRKYHTLEHLQRCLSVLDSVSDQLKKPSFVELALWFHDYYYDFTRSINELRSATKALEFLNQNGFGLSDVLRVREHILATDHAACDTPTPFLYDDTAFMVDIDMSILGANKEEFLNYEKQIREEYAHVPQKEYTVNRVKVLKALLNLNAGNIYHTLYFKERLSSKARTNIKELIRSLCNE